MLTYVRHPITLAVLGVSVTIGVFVLLASLTLHGTASADLSNVSHSQSVTASQSTDSAVVSPNGGPVIRGDRTSLKHDSGPRMTTTPTSGSVTPVPTGGRGTYSYTYSGPSTSSTGPSSPQPSSAPTNKPAGPGPAQSTPPVIIKTWTPKPTPTPTPSPSPTPPSHSPSPPPAPKADLHLSASLSQDGSTVPVIVKGLPAGSNATLTWKSSHAVTMNLPGSCSADSCPITQDGTTSIDVSAPNGTVLTFTVEPVAPLQETTPADNTAPVTVPAPPAPSASPSSTASATESPSLGLVALWLGDWVTASTTTARRRRNAP